MALIDKLTAIGDAIRTKTGKSDTLTLEQMATEIEGIEMTDGGSGSLPIIIVSDIPANHVVVMVDGIEFTTECIEEVEENVDG